MPRIVFFLSKFLPALLSPVAFVCFLLAVSIFALYRRSYRLAATANFAALAILLILGNPLFEGVLLKPLELRDLAPNPLPTADAIVVLGGVTSPAFAPQPIVHLGGGADRVTYAVKLYREGRAPLIVLSGAGMPWNSDLPSEAEQMAELLRIMGVPASAIVKETGSHDTHENAAYIKPVLAARHLRRILLVTSAVSMPGSLAAFRHENIDAVPAPVDFVTPGLDAELSASHVRDQVGWLETIALFMIPNPETLTQVDRALHEYLGLLVYRVNGWI